MHIRVYLKELAHPARGTPELSIATLHLLLDWCKDFHCPRSCSILFCGGHRCCPLQVPSSPFTEQPACLRTTLSSLCLLLPGPPPACTTSAPPPSHSPKRVPSAYLPHPTQWRCSGSACRPLYASAMQPITQASKECDEVAVPLALSRLSCTAAPCAMRWRSWAGMAGQARSWQSCWPQAAECMMQGRGWHACCPLQCSKGYCRWKQTRLSRCCGTSSSSASSSEQCDQVQRQQQRAVWPGAVERAAAAPAAASSVTRCKLHSYIEKKGLQSNRLTASLFIKKSSWQFSVTRCKSQLPLCLLGYLEDLDCVQLEFGTKTLCAPLWSSEMQ